MSPRLLVSELCHRNIPASQTSCQLQLIALLHCTDSRVSFLTPLAFKTNYYYLCLLVCLLVDPFKKAMDYPSSLAVRGREGGGCDRFPRRALLIYLLLPSACPGLLEASQFNPILHRALDLDQGIQVWTLAFIFLHVNLQVLI